MNTTRTESTKTDKLTIPTEQPGPRLYPKKDSRFQNWWPTLTLKDPEAHELISTCGAGRKTKKVLAVLLANLQKAQDEEKVLRFVRSQSGLEGLYENPHGIGRDTMNNALGILEDAGLIEEWKPEERRKRQPSGIISTVRDLGVLPEHCEVVHEKHVRVRKKYKVIGPDGKTYTRTKYLKPRLPRRMMPNIEAINRMLLDMDVNVATEAGERDWRLVHRTLYRSFKGDLKTGGRFYGHWVQYLKKDERRYISIDGEECCEVDFKAMGPRILYAQKGITFDGDPYDVPGVPRKEAKKMLNKILNGSFRILPQNNYDDPDTIDQHVMLTKLQDRHPQLREHFFPKSTGKPLSWTLTQYVDSQIAERIMLKVPCLPIHDGFIINESKADELVTAARKASADVLNGIELPVEVKSFW